MRLCHAKRTNMKIRIFNVEHGFCAYVVADNGNVILIDAGHNQETGFRPSNYLPAAGCTAIEKFIVSNYDEDHVSDLHNLRDRLPIQILHRNNSISADSLGGLKQQAGQILSGMQALLDMIETYTGTVTNPPEFSGITLKFFQHDYPAFEDTNNLSLVTFLHYGNVHMIFPGDLEKAGWRALLKQQLFQGHLRQVNIFVASHHGRESGYCPEIFDYCNPEVIIVSDESIQYETQEVGYSRHARGIPWGTGRRYVLTTRQDGMITIEQRPGQSPQVTAAQ